MNSTFDALGLLEIYLPEYIKTITYVPWVFSLLGSLLIGFSGVLPMFIIPTGIGDKGNDIANRKCTFFSLCNFNQPNLTNQVNSTQPEAPVVSKTIN